MSKAGKITAAISGAFLLLIVVAIILIATFDWNRLKPTINQKVSAELNRPFAIRGDLGVVWERQKQETGWRSWVPWPHVHAEDIILVWGGDRFCMVVMWGKKVDGVRNDGGCEAR